MPTTTQSAIAELEDRFGAHRLERDVPLAPLTTFRIGGPADVLFRARTPEELAEVILMARQTEMPHFLLGMGANILIGDRGFRGLVIRNEASDIEFVGENRVRAASGAIVYRDLIDATVARGLGGLHHFVGIPSTVGGAIWQNLHFLSPAPERERTVYIEEVVAEAAILSEEGDVRVENRDYFRFGYDYSILHDRDDVVLSVTFDLQPSTPEELRVTIRENLQWRDDRHPDLWLYPSAGSIFQKLEGIGAGRLIDQCGLKGHVHPSGRAQIFQRHANIMVNLGGARASDIRELVDLAQRTVLKELGYSLQPEIGFIGEF